MIEESVPLDWWHDTRYEWFSEQRVQELNNSGRIGVEDSLPFFIEPSRIIPTAKPQKSTTNTSSDSGVNSPRVLSSAMPVTPENTHNRQLYSMPSTTRMNPLSGPLTPIQQFVHNSRKSKTKEPKYNHPSLIIFTHNLCLEFLIDRAIKIKSSILVCFLSPFAHMVFHSYGTHRFSTALSIFFTSFQITMMKSHQIYPDCIWHVPPEWHGLNYYSALLTKVYWIYYTNMVWVCVTTIHPTSAKLNVKRKSNKQVHFDCQALASLYDFLCHQSLTFSDPLLGVLHSYLSTRFLSDFFDYNAYGSSDTKYVRSIDSSVSALYSDDSTYSS